MNFEAIVYISLSIKVFCVLFAMGASRCCAPIAVVAVGIVGAVIGVVCGVRFLVSGCV
jgi:hypothetical protein